MRNLLILFAFLVASMATAAETAPPLPDISPEDYGLAVAYGAMKANDPALVSACETNPTVAKNLDLLAEDDIAIYAEETDHHEPHSMLDETILFATPVLERASRLTGFVHLISEDTHTGDWPVHQVAPRVQAMNDKFRDLAAAKTYAAQIKALYQDLKANPRKLPDDTTIVGCLIAAMQTTRLPDQGMAGRALKRVLPAKLAEYEAYRSPEGYQASRWGMTLAEVAKVEGVTTGASKVVRIDGHQAKVNYLFTDGRLSGVQVVLQEACKAFPCYERFLKVTELLSSKYGRYADETETDQDRLDRGASQLWQRFNTPVGLIQEGYRREIHSWSQAETRIEHTLRSTAKPFDKTPGRLIEEITYTSLRFEPRAKLLKQEQKEKALKARQKNI